MKHLLVVFFTLIFIWACSDSDIAPARDDGANKEIVDGETGNDPSPDNDQPPTTDIKLQSLGMIATEFCSNQTQLQLLSSSLLSAFSPKGNTPDLAYCGGSIELQEQDATFAINISDYCVAARGQQVTLNGNIDGAIEAGRNFTSDIEQLSIVGDQVNLSVTGITWDGRDDDMFISLNITDNLAAVELLIEEVSIKKGELDFGYITFPQSGRFKFLFTEHFNAELTKGHLIIYGDNEETITIYADSGVITADYKASKQDTSTALQTNCNG